MRSVIYHPCRKVAEVGKMKMKKMMIGILDEKYATGYASIKLHKY